jgi:hypothetical protein
LTLTYCLQETTEPVTEIHDDDPEHFEVMLKYFYTKKYKSPDEISELVRRFLFPIGVHALADKYNVEGLSCIAIHRFGCIEAHWNHFCDFKLEEEEVQAVVVAHYGVCATIGPAMGRSMAEFVL